MNAKNNTSEKQALLVALDDYMEHKDARLICSEFTFHDEMAILAEWHGEFVTWKFCQSGCYYGHYHDNQYDAHIDFLDRSGLKTAKEAEL